MIRTFWAAGALLAASTAAAQWVDPPPPAPVQRPVPPPPGAAQPEPALPPVPPAAAHSPPRPPAADPPQAPSREHFEPPAAYRSQRPPLDPAPPDDPPPILAPVPGGEENRPPPEPPEAREVDPEATRPSPPRPPRPRPRVVPDPVPTVRDDAGGRAPTGDPAEREARRTVSAFLRYWSQPNDHILASPPAFYGATVMLDGQRRTIDQVWREKRRFIRRWPERRYVADPDRMAVECKARRTVCTVLTAVDFQTFRHGGARRSAGIAMLELGLYMAPDGPVVIAEQNRVMTRGKPDDEPEPPR